MNESDRTFEDQLGRLLEARADRILVVPDLEGVLAAPDGVGRAASVSHWWLAMAAAALMAVGIGAVAIAGARPAGNDEATEVRPAQAWPVEVSPVTAGQLIVWLDPLITPGQIDAITLELESSPAVLSLSYVDRWQTWTEFSNYFADQPEVLELVEPEQLPTSFRITSPDPAEVKTLVLSLPGVDGVEMPGGPAHD